MSQQLKAKFKTDSKKPVALFISSVYAILQERKFPDIVDWNNDGTALVIMKPKEFSAKVLPTYFRHNHITSFVRQLHLYSFHRHRNQNFDHVYSHKLFQKDKDHLLQGIKRKDKKNILLAVQKAVENNPQIAKNSNPSGFSYENRMLKKLHSEAVSRISKLEGRVTDLTIQSQALWSHLNKQKEKEKDLKSLLNELMKVYDFPAEQLSSLIGDTDLSTSQTSVPRLEINEQCNTCVDIQTLLAQKGETEGSTASNSHDSPNIVMCPETNYSQKCFKPTDNLSLLSSLFSKLSKEMRERDEASVANMQQRRNRYMEIDPHEIDLWNLEGEYLRAVAVASEKAEALSFNQTFNDLPLLGKRKFEELEKTTEIGEDPLAFSYNEEKICVVPQEDFFIPKEEF